MIHMNNQEFNRAVLSGIRQASWAVEQNNGTNWSASLMRESLLMAITDIESALRMLESDEEATEEQLAVMLRRTAPTLPPASSTIPAPMCLGEAS